MNLVTFIQHGKTGRARKDLSRAFSAPCQSSASISTAATKEMQSISRRGQMRLNKEGR